MRAISERYRRRGQAASSGMGCVLAALGPELTRQLLSVRNRIEAVREAYRERLLAFVPGRTRQEKLTKFQLLFPSMAGVLTSVRMNVSPEKREELLTEARSFFIRLFAQE